MTLPVAELKRLPAQPPARPLNAFDIAEEELFREPERIANPAPEYVRRRALYKRLEAMDKKYEKCVSEGQSYLSAVAGRYRVNIQLLLVQVCIAALVTGAAIFTVQQRRAKRIEDSGREDEGRMT